MRCLSVLVGVVCEGVGRCAPAYVWAVTELSRGFHKFMSTSSVKGLYDVLLEDVSLNHWGCHPRSVQGTFLRTGDILTMGFVLPQLKGCEACSCGCSHF